MPYAIRRGASESCRFEVVVETTGKRVGCHPDRASARRHLAALYANVPEAKTISSLMDRESDFWVNYRKTLVKAVTPTFTRIFLAGAKAALKVPAVERKEWDEEAHPRDEGGKFTDSAAESAPSAYDSWPSTKMQEDFEKAFPQHSGQYFVRERGNVRIGLMPHGMEKDLELHWLQSTQRGSNDAIVAMREVVNLADKHGVTLHLEATPWSRADIEGTERERNEPKPMELSKLMQFYEHFGFQKYRDVGLPDTTGNRMVRYPNPGKTKWYAYDFLMEVMDESFGLVEKKGPVVATAVSNLPKNLPGIAKKAIKQYVNEWSRLIEDTTYEGVREAVLTSRATGGGVEAVIQTIAPLFAPERVQRIAVTETTRLFGRGAQASYEAMGLREWGWSSVNDPFVCGSPGKELTDNAISHLVFEEPCYDLDGKTFPIDQMFEPNHVNCLVDGTRVLSPSSILAATRRVYEGEVVTIRTTRGDELSVTPNHPVLTFAGWKPAGEIKEGDKLVGHSFSDASFPHVGVRSPSTHNPYEKQVPTPINEIWESLGVKSSMRHAVVPSSPEDFHGDGSYGKIDVVLPNSILGHSTDTPVGKPVEDGLFVFAGDDPLSGHSSGNESGVRILSSSPSGMGNTGIVEPLFRSKSSLLQKLRIGLRSDRGVPLKQCSTNGEPGTPEVASQAGLTLTGDVSLADFLDRKGMLVSPYTTLLVSEVIRIPRDVARHVYNLQTSDGFYVAEGIVTHNCRCFSVPIVTYGGEEKDWDPDLHPRDELGQFALAGGGSAVAEAPENTGGALPNGSLAIPGTTYSNRTNPTDSYYERVKALMAERGAPSFQLDNVDIEREQIAKQYGGDFDMYHIDGTNIEVGVPLDRDIDPDSVHQAVETIRGLNEKLPPPGEVMVLLGRDLTEMGPGVQGVTTVPTTSDPDIRKGVGALMLISDNVVANPYQNAGEVYPGVARAEEVTAIQYVISHEWGHVVDRFPIEKEVDTIFGVVAGTDPETTPYVDAYLNRGTSELNALEAAIRDGKVSRGSQMDYAVRSEAMNFIALGAKENFAESIAEYVLSKEPGAAPMNEWTEKYLKEIGFLTPTGRVSRKKALDFSLTTFIDDFVGPSQELPEVLKEWDEDLHPRDEAGRFTSGDGGIDVESGVAYVADMSMGGTYVGSRVVDEQEFVNKYQNAEVEHGLISTEDGRKIEVTSNNQGTIHLEKEAIRAMRNGDFIHNHPLPGIPLSGGDVVAAVQTGCKSITAVSSDGSISRMEEPKGGWLLGSKEDAQSAAMALAVFHPDYDANKPEAYIKAQNRALWAFARDTGATYTYIPGRR